MKRSTWRDAAIHSIANALLEYEAQCLGTRVKIIYQLGRADSDIPFGQTFLPLPKNLGFNLDLL